jgi:prophage antirepressor-like protein
MFELTTFNNSQFGEVRTVTINGEPWFVGKDICAIFNDSNHNRSLSRVNENDKMPYEITDSLGRKQTVTVINEYGLYDLLWSMKPQRSNKDGVQDAYPTEIKERIEKLEKFKYWVTHEVLPSIRKTGGYQMQKPMTQLEILAAQAQALVEQERRLNAVEESTKALDAKIDAAADAFMAPSFSVETWRTETKSAISAIVEADKLSYGVYTGELYKRLENVAGCNLADRQTRMRNRMRKEGATTSQCNSVTKLYIISLDQKLRAIFDHIMVQEKASRLMKGGVA